MSIYLEHFVVIMFVASTVQRVSWNSCLEKLPTRQRTLFLVPFLLAVYTGQTNQITN